MKNIKKNVENLEALFRDIQSSVINVNNETQKLEIDEDGVIESGNLEYGISELEDAIDKFDEGFNDTMAMILDVVGVIEEWKID